MIPTASKRAAHGAQMLDLAHPGWHREIDLSILDVDDVQDCVLGQLYGHYYDGVRRLNLTKSAAVVYGFHLDSWMRTYRALTRAWRREVQARLDADELQMVWWIDEAADFEPERELVGAGLV